MSHERFALIVVDVPLDNAIWDVVAKSPTEKNLHLNSFSFKSDGGGKGTVSL